MEKIDDKISIRPWQDKRDLMDKILTREKKTKVPKKDFKLESEVEHQCPV